MTWNDLGEVLPNISTRETQQHDDESNFLAILRKNPQYFIAWYGEDRRPISGRYGAGMISHLLEYSRRPRSRREIENYEFSEFMPLQELIYFFIEAFLTIQNQRKRWSYAATRMINGGKKLANMLVDKGHVNADYLPALEYLYRWILANIIFAKGKLIATSKLIDIASYANYTTQWDKLPSKSKALVTAAKCFFLASMKMTDSNPKAQAKQELRKVVNLDPLVYEWHYNLGNWIRCERKTLAGMSDNFLLKQCPTEEEMQILWETYDVCTYTKIGDDGKATTLRRMALAGVCQGMAEVVRYRCRASLGGSFKFGGLHLANNFATVEFIRKQTKAIQDEERATFAEYIRFGEIFAGILPHQFRDYKMAEVFYKEAYLIMPSNSKINHKLGTLYFTSDELRDIPRSLHFLRRAVKREFSNVFATLDLLGVMISSVSEHLAEIEEVIQLYLERIKDGFTGLTESELKWILGCAKFMTVSDKEDAVTVWISGQELNPTKNAFAKLLLSIKRYHWDNNLINLNLVKSTLENSLRTRTDTNEIAILRNMIETLPTATNRGTFQTSLPTRGGFSKRGGCQESDLDTNWRTSSRPVPNRGEVPTNNFGRRRTLRQQHRPTSPINWR
ncbi:uncharacterized protein LOC110842021 isoform X2 [Folsomia candida]|nr:uncharacterized protein LOC110842021 isoform X2 [Folsomia candida]